MLVKLTDMMKIILPSFPHSPSMLQHFIPITVNITFTFTVETNMKCILSPSTFHNRYSVLVIFSACFYCEVYGFLCDCITLKQYFFNCIKLQNTE